MRGLLRSCSNGIICRMIIVAVEEKQALVPLTWVGGAPAEQGLDRLGLGVIGGGFGKLAAFF